CRLIGALILANIYLGRQEAFAELVKLLLVVDPTDDVRGACVEALTFMSCGLVAFGALKDASVLRDRIDPVSAPVLAKDAVVRGWAGFAHAYYDYHSGDNPWRAWCSGDEGAEAFRQINDHRNRKAPEVVAGLVRAALGDEDGAVAM